MLCFYTQFEIPQKKYITTEKKLLNKREHTH